MDDNYLMKSERVLDDDHSFVRLVDTMPGVRFCDYAPEEPEGRNEVEAWENIQHCHRAGIVETNGQYMGSTGFWCRGHVPDDREIPAITPGDPGWRGKPARFLDYTEYATAPGDQRIVDAARVSIVGLGVEAATKDAKLIRYMLKNKHTTPFEHIRFTFHARMPIFVARQWIRHRTGSFSEQSARYGGLRPDFYYPTLERLEAGGQAKENKQGSGTALDPEVALEAQNQIKIVADAAYEEYSAMLDAGVARELARMVLPVNIYTQWFWTTDLHNLMHFMRLRLHEHAQWEVRQYAESILLMAEAVAPITIGVFRESL
jgi:thymidylate synthase (FAD)